MKPDEFAARTSAVLGERGWQTRLAKALGIDPSTVRRWMNGSIAVPEYAVAVVELLEVVPAAFRPERFFKLPRH
ncbi:HTH_XRE domain containing protein [uncultured Caudovirales phage]|uniref:HTH_XRE domain containing protein n=1 Tax=uncultured Caudovirales phage TaxID=2100421 RepID=A0A6J5KPR3_9CAUD|nr:HTH_XRE domain containing protein [uncultured Caudovirales phage]CAB4123871.1 HTH_XRE domain containing protein [uncultured Caudovirales phage]